MRIKYIVNNELKGKCTEYKATCFDKVDTILLKCRKIERTYIKFKKSSNDINESMSTVILRLCV